MEFRRDDYRTKKKKFIEENNKQTLEQVITDVRNTKGANETMSENLLESLKKQGFLK